MMTQDDLDRDWLAEREHAGHETPVTDCDLCPEPESDNDGYER